MKATSDMYHYHDFLIDFGLLYLVFIKSVCGHDYHLFTSTIQHLIPYVFSLNRHHYARWLTVFMDDLSQLENSNPDLADRITKEKRPRGGVKRETHAMPGRPREVLPRYNRMLPHWRSVI